MARRGLGRGRGKGYKNLQSRDPRVHSQSARGIKQPQKIPQCPMLSDLKKKDKKIFIKSIEITRAEGSSVYDPNLGKTQKFNNVKDADKRLLEISRTAPATGGYDKTDVKVTFEDGTTYEGRWDIKHFSQMNADLTIKDHIKQNFNFFAGNTLRGKEAIEMGWTTKEQIREAKDWLEKYDLNNN